MKFTQWAYFISDLFVTLSPFTLAGSSRPGHGGIAVWRAWHLSQGQDEHTVTTCWVSRDTPWVVLVAVSCVCHNLPSFSKTSLICMFLYLLNILANRIFLYVKGKWADHRAIWPTEESLPSLGCGLYKNPLVIKTEDNCDKNKDIILK